MKTLAAGTLKYLLPDTRAITRNGERAKQGEPPVAVVEATADGLVVHNGYAVSAAGPVTFAYNGGRVLFKTRLTKGAPDIEVRGAFVTEGEVQVDDGVAEAAPEAAPTKTKGAPKAPTKKETSA